LSALSISRVVGDVSSNENREKLAILRQQWAASTSIYNAEHPQVRMLQEQITSLETALKAAPKSGTPIIQLKGNVEIRTDTMILMANEVYYYEDTGEIEARGTVRVKPNSK
jgi:lipopolysaccharide assembly outer membrane protein LptD (OstA)